MLGAVGVVPACAGVFSLVTPRFMCLEPRTHWCGTADTCVRNGGHAGNGVVVVERLRSWWGWGWADQALTDEQCRQLTALLPEQGPAAPQYPAAPMPVPDPAELATEAFGAERAAELLRDADALPIAQVIAEVVAAEPPTPDAARDVPVSSC